MFKKIGDIASSQMLHNSDWDNNDAMVVCIYLEYSVKVEVSSKMGCESVWQYTSKLWLVLKVYI